MKCITTSQTLNVCKNRATLGEDGCDRNTYNLKKKSHEFVHFGRSKSHGGMLRIHKNVENVVTHEGKKNTKKGTCSKLQYLPVLGWHMVFVTTVYVCHACAKFKPL